MPEPVSDRDFARSLDWNLLKLFREIAEAGTISQAALQLDRKQPTVSQALQRLEALLGVRLCERGARGLTLTAEGQLLAETAERLAQSVQDLPARMADAAAATSIHLRLLVISNLVYPALDAGIAVFHQKHARAEIDVDVAPWITIQDAILQGEADVGVGPARSFHADLAYRFLFYEINRPFCGRGHPLYGRRPGSVTELAPHRFILTGADEPDELRRFRLDNGLGRSVVGRADRLEEAKRLTKLGLGICFLPEAFAAAEAADGSLWPLLPEIDEPAIPIYAVFSRTADVACQRFVKDILVSSRSGGATPGS